MNFSFRFYWHLFVRRLPVMLAMLLVCSAIGFITARNLPPTYATTARLLVEDPQIDTGANTEIDGAEQLQVIEQRLLTRANLIDIASEQNVFEDIRSMTPDAVVEAMKSQTYIRRSSGRNQATLMSITFQARSGQIAADVLNEYLTLIELETNTSRVEQVSGQLEFFEQEVSRLDADLSQQSLKIVDFRNQNADALPEDMDFRQGRQTLLLERAARLERDLTSARRQREDMVRVFEETGRVDMSNQDRLTPEQQQLQSLQMDLDSARAVYSDTNPKVVLLMNQIARLEASVQSQPETPSDSSAQSATLSVLQISLNEVDDLIQSLESEEEATKLELERLALSIASTAANAVALSALERDYENVQSRYNSAVQNLDAARLDSRIVETARGQRVTVIEGADVPQDPTGPNRLMIAAMGVSAGLGLAAAFFLLLELINRTIRRPAEIQSRFGITPIAIVPYIESSRQKLIRRGFLIFAVLAVLVGVPLMLWYIDTIYPLELIAAKIMNRVGL